MLFDARTLSGIADGSITTTYRRWAAPRVRAGGSQLTKVGRISFTSVEQVDPARLTARDLRGTGFDSVAALLARADGRDRGDLPLWRIRLVLAGEDPRVALRADAHLDDRTLASLDASLDRMDAAADHPWTRDVLALIGRRPGVVSTELAAERGEERYFFKNRVRRLKTLGLTESLEVGYRLSPRGEAFLRLRGSDAARRPGTT